eukprot:2907028-Amphidinium_carterae.1
MSTTCLVVTAGVGTPFHALCFYYFGLLWLDSTLSPEAVVLSEISKRRSKASSLCTLKPEKAAEHNLSRTCRAKVVGCN